MYIPILSLAILVALVAIGFRTSDTTAPTTEDSVVSDNAWPSQEVEKLTIQEKTGNYNINAQYPKTNSDSINLYLKSFVEEQITQFKADTSWVTEIDSASNQILTLDISYDFVNSKNAQNYIFSIASYTGGAHGLQVRETFSYDKVGQAIGFSSLFSNGLYGLETFSSLVQKELLKREGADKDWVADGAGPKEENYSSFVITDTGVKVLFDPYQVAAYAAGPVDVEIPFSAFAKIANPDIFSVNQQTAQ